MIEFWPETLDFNYSGKNIAAIFADQRIFLGVTQDEFHLCIRLNERASDEEAAAAIVTALRELFDMDK